MKRVALLAAPALLAGVVGAAQVAGGAAAAPPGRSAGPAGGQAAEADPFGNPVAPVLYQPSMNVFRRFSADAERMYQFYRDVLGFEQLPSIGAVARFQAGASEFKLTRRVGGRQYQSGGVRDATGLRLVTFFFPDETALAGRFTRHGSETTWSRPEPRPGK